MFTWGSKYFIGLTAGALIGAIAYGLVTGGGPVGVLSSGYKGGVGDHVGYAVLLFAAGSLAIMGFLSVLLRDGDAEVMAARAGVATVPPVQQPADPSYWGPIAAFGVAALAIGLALSPVFYILGIAVLAVATLMWAVQAWADRATGDPEVNRVIRGRVIGPVELPILSLLAIACVAVGVSRVFLAVSKTGATVVGALFTIFVFGAAVLMSKVELKRSVVNGIVALGALAILAGGIVGAAVGERDFHEHEEDHSEVEG